MLSAASSNGFLVGGMAAVGVAMILTACSSSGTPSATSSSGQSGVATTLPGADTCANHTGPNDASPEFYRQQYDTGLAKQLKDRLDTYGSAVDSGDSQRIGESAAVLAGEVRADAKLVSDFPRLYGCYDKGVLADVVKAAEAFGTQLDAMSCSGAEMCKKVHADTPNLVGRAKPQLRSFVSAINTYAAQFGGEQLPMPRNTAGFKMRV